MRNARILLSAVMGAVLLAPTVAYANWSVLRFGADGPDALQKLAALSEIAADGSTPTSADLGIAATGSLQSIKAKFKSRFFEADSRFIFSDGRLSAVLVGPTNISRETALQMLVSEYGAPALVIDGPGGQKDYAWRDKESNNSIVLRTTNPASYYVLYRPLLSPHSTGF